MGRHINKELRLRYTKSYYTKNYDLFVSHGFNRDLHSDPLLEESMRSVGWMPSKPMQVQRIDGGKYQIICGHHRFEIAKRLGIDVCFSIDESNTDIFLLEGSSKQRWSLDDFVHARALAGDKECIGLLDFQAKHALPLGVCVSLFGGECAGSGNKAKALKAGTFKSRNVAHAEAVANVANVLYEAGVLWARSSQFIKAVSLALCVPEFDEARFLRLARNRPAAIRRRALAAEYLDEIEQVYNYHTAAGRLNVRFRALEESRKRHDTFGGHRPQKKRAA